MTTARGARRSDRSSLTYADRDAAQRASLVILPIAAAMRRVSVDQEFPLQFFLPAVLPSMR